jgi:hypothetical protein
MEKTIGIDYKMTNMEQISDSELSASPFRTYEEKYCRNCEDYRGCLGLIDSTTMDLQDSKVITGDKGLDSMIRSMGGLTFSARFKMILDCAWMRDVISKVD